MRVYKIELMVIDFDKLGATQIMYALEQTKYPNRCIRPVVMCWDTRDIGEWEDDNPLNFIDTAGVAFNNLFEPED